MKKHTVAACVAAMAAAAFSGCGSVGSMMGGGSNLFSQIGGQNIRNMAGDLVHKSIADPRLAALHSPNVDAAASSGKVTDQLCSMMGGGCRAPLWDSQVAAAANRLTPEQSHAINDHFDSSLSRASSDPAIRDRIRQAVGDKLPGVLGGLL